MASANAEKVINVLETDAAHVLAVAGTAFGMSIAELGTNYTKAGIIAAVVAAVHATFIHFFPQPASDAAPKP